MCTLEHLEQTGALYAHTDITQFGHQLCLVMYESFITGLVCLGHF